MRKNVIFVLILVLLLAFTSACRSNKNTRYKKLPKRGKMPCPVKDC